MNKYILVPFLLPGIKTAVAQTGNVVKNGW
jgi:hypothetical protein